MSSIQEINGNNKDFIPDEIINCLKGQILPFDHSKNLFPPNTTLSLKGTQRNLRNLKLPSQLDKSILRGEEIEKFNSKIEKLPVQTLIPDEFYIRKDELKCHLEYENDEPNSIEEAMKNLILFPTENPQSREEVKYLYYTLQKMLDKQKQPDFELDNCCVKTEDDIDRMINLIIQMDDIYNVILHEISRQIWASSEARSLVLLELRTRYMELVRKLPEELSKLKGTIREQAVRDKRLTTQIEEFQMAIKYLTEQLKEVKIRDIKVTEDAEHIQKDLESALQDSARSKTLLNEYHILYDLQKQRLERQMSVINNEKEEWSSLAFALSLKISDESLLNTTKRLKLITKKLFQMSQHFAIFLSDRDTVLTSQIHDVSGRCLKQITQIQTETSKTLNNFYDLFYFLREKFEFFLQKISNISNCNLDTVTDSLSAIKELVLEENLKKIFNDISLLNVSNYRTLHQSIGESLDKWQILLSELSSRKSMEINKGIIENSILKNVSEHFDMIKIWLLEFSTRIDLIKSFEPFFRDLKSYIEKIETKIRAMKLKNGTENNNEDIMEFVRSMGNELYLEMFINQELKDIVKNEDFSEFNKFYNAIQKFIVTFSSTIDLFDSDLLKSISAQQSKVTDWIIEALYLFSDIEHVNDIEHKYKNFSEAFEVIVSTNNTIFHYIIEWTEKFILASEGENKKIELAEYVEENTSWTSVAEMLIKNIGEKIEQELMFRRKKSEKEIAKMTFENLDELINQIICKNTDQNIFLAIDTVKNLQSEIKESQSRITSSVEKRMALSDTLKEQKSKIQELEDKISTITIEYRELIKTD